MPASLVPYSLKLEIPEDLGPHSTGASWWTFEVELQLCPRHADDAHEAEAILSALCFNETHDMGDGIEDEGEPDLTKPDQLVEDIEVVIADAEVEAMR
jgi:hypothetical protein